MKTKHSYNTEEDYLFLYFDKLEKFDLNKEQEVEYLKRIKQGDKEAFDEFTFKNQPLVVKIAKAYAKYSNQEVADLIQVGNLGLLKAISKFDLSQNVKFSTYATYCIKTSCYTYVNENGIIIKIPAEKGFKIKKLNAAIEMLTEVFERCPTNEEVMAELNWTEKELNDVKKYDYKIISFDDNKKSKEVMSIHKLLADDLNEIVEEKEKNELVEKIMYCGILDKREISILRNRYCFDGDEIPTYQTLGEKFHITRERARQIEYKAIYRLRKNRRITAFTDYVSEKQMKLIRKH